MVHLRTDGVVVRLCNETFDFHQKTLLKKTVSHCPLKHLPLPAGLLGGHLPQEFQTQQPLTLCLPQNSFPRPLLPQKIQLLLQMTHWIALAHQHVNIYLCSKFHFAKRRVPEDIGFPPMQMRGHVCRFDLHFFAQPTS